MTNETNNKPADTIRDKGLKVAIWRNTTDQGGFRYSVGPVIRSYRQEDQWKETTYLASGEILRGSRLIAKAFDRIVELEDADRDAAKTTTSGAVQ